MAWETFGLGQTTIPEPEIAFRFILAVMFGAAIGFEREIREVAAGLRTHMLTSLAAAVFTVLTFEIYHRFTEAGQASNLDPIRLIEAVTAGVSFLAAGTIIHGSGQVKGLTTGAGMWLAGALGVACGAGFYVIAIMGVVLALIIAILLRRVEMHLLNSKESDEGS